MSDALDVGRGVSALWVRAAVGAAAAGIVVDLVLADVAGLVGWTAAVLAVLCVLLPASPVALLLIVLAAVAVAVGAPAPFSPALLALIPLTHALHLSSGIAAVLPRGARVHGSALVAPLRRAAAIQLAVGLIVIVATFLPTGPTPPAVELVALLSSAAMALAVILLERSRR
ncbi:hypothetical protein [Actinokineospora sp. UTMC 2448]|uniref:hypothetical protein n=1 Tax=Actinokineospora sp. UTMC 2448 TaxID=2268449 RepID=UPI0021645C06|nr:hypothetical protein [Actinokineospora sp. UTMC 2448]UVS76995.1 hypothetical protein Actkin_00694 [Actinokineospora sp. UTMC 2448]